MFKNLMASLGFGAAKIKLELPGPNLRQGETIEGKVIVSGGKTPQKVEQVYLHLDVISQYEHNDKMQVFEDTLDKYCDMNPFDITGEDFRLEIPFSYTVPLNIPLSLGRTRYQMKAGLDIKNAINPTDQAEVRILPCPEVESALLGLENLGFKHKRDSGEFNGKTQLFEYAPTDFLCGKLDELEVSFKLTSTSLILLMEIDKKGRGLAGLLMEAFDADEKHVSLTVPREALLSGGKPDVESATKILKDFINAEYKML